MHPFQSRFFNPILCWSVCSFYWNLIFSLYESSTEELNLSGNDCSEITSSQLFTALNHLRVLNLTAAKVGTDTLLQVMSEPNLVQRGRIVFSSSDFPSKNIQSRWGKKNTKIGQIEIKAEKFSRGGRGGEIRICLHLTERYLNTWREFIQRYIWTTKWKCPTLLTLPWYLDRVS